ncbi:MAG TPA: M14 family zinc carboxypeptidase, partial [Micromonosporaceae bacterium]
VDTLHFLQAYWWTSNGQTFVGTQVATTATDDPDVEITVTWTTASGATGSYQLERFIDDGEYQYHFAVPQPVPATPVSLVATSSLGGTTRATPAQWPGVQPPSTPSAYQKDFITAYMNPEDVRARIKRLARQYPDLVDVINLPNQTQGYRRTASGYLGDPATAAVIVETVKFGDQGQNGIQVKSVDPGAANRPLKATYADRVLTVSLATGADGAVISTVDQVAAFISAKYPQRFRAYVEDGSAGQIMPVAGPARLSDGLQASSDVPRKPWTVQALRIGVHRDGSRIGVLAYSQEHAREWATPLVTLEFAERMLANYATDPETHQLLNDVDVFVVPTVNPDGANYSFNDYNFQRRNMDDWCTGADRDPANRNRWGVDVNRNYDVGSVFDGYVGGSLNCLSDVAAGTGELSEPESRNIIALAQAHPNIKFAMNVHSYGGYFMWPPGAYKAAGRITLPRPSIEESAQFLAAAKQIVSAIASERGTVTWPAQTGPVADVLYSAAGNSADELYYEEGVFAWDFEVGNDIWNATTQEWDGVGFQPPYSEAHGEAMEYATGLVQLVRVAEQYQQTHS